MTKDKELLLIELLKELAREVYETNLSKGFDNKQMDDGKLSMLMVTEIAEHFDALRNGNPPDDKIPEFNGSEAELADTVLRALSYSYAREWRLPEAMIAKSQYNSTRPFKHGRKEF